MEFFVTLHVEYSDTDNEIEICDKLVEFFDNSGFRLWGFLGCTKFKHDLKAIKKATKKHVKAIKNAW